MFASNTSQVANDAVFIEDTFSTTLYTGNGSTQTITNGIDLAGKGGLVWIKKRSEADNHFLFDTNRGATYRLISNATNGSSDAGDSLVAFNSNGFNLDGGYTCNGSGNTLVSWTFRKQPKFFDVVTYTGNGTTQAIAHNLGSVPACIIVKCTSQGATNWAVYHRGLNGGSNPENYLLFLNDTMSAAGPNSVFWGGTAPTSTNFYVGNYQNTGSSGLTYVAYLFAHNAGGFGLTGTDNVISCGSFTTDSGGNGSITLGYEPQWVLFKRTDSTQNWVLMDNMRNFVASPNDSSALYPNLSNAESVFGQIAPNATGFSGSNFSSSATYIYIAIRRGPMKVPTSGTSVFAPLATRSSGSNQATPMFNAGWPVDLMMQGFKSGNINNAMVIPRLTNNILRTSNTDAETNGATSYDFGGMLGVLSVGGADNSSSTICGWNFRRAPSFFDEVCYTGTGVAGQTFAHNLGVAPELMIVKRRNSSSDASWIVYAASQGVSAGGQLNSSGAFGSLLGYYQWNNTAPTASVFTLGDGATDVNNSAGTYVWYGFATCAGVSKCGTFTGNGSSQTINCGFTGGARFVMIKATSTTGDWLVADSARGIVSGNDPYLELNTTNAEVTGEDWLDTDSTGFVVNEVSGSNANTNGVTYIYLAIA